MAQEKLTQAQTQTKIGKEMFVYTTLKMMKKWKWKERKINIYVSSFKCHIALLQESKKMFIICRLLLVKRIVENVVVTYLDRYEFGEQKNEWKLFSFFLTHNGARIYRKNKEKNKW